MTVITAALKFSVVVSTPMSAPSNLIGLSSPKRNGALMQLKASFSTCLCSFLSLCESGPLKGFSGVLYWVFSRNSTKIEGSGGLLGGSFRMLELRVRVGSGGSCGVRSMKKKKKSPNDRVFCFTYHNTNSYPSHMTLSLSKS